MQNNVTELTQKLLRSLDSNYNVIDMPSVIEIISLLEKVAITKELLETTRLGRHVNELRRKATNESLAKRAKELVKKWRSMVIPESNGQTPVELEEKSKKRANKERLESVPMKRPKMNGQTTEYDFSDNSNSSFKDVINTADAKRDLMLMNTDSNSSCTDKQDPLLLQQLPKKRGRKKGSKNHRSLLDEAETSFTNKMAVSRGNAKVKTTQELVASLHNKNTVLGTLTTKPIEDLNERAAKLTERVSYIDQKLNTNASRYKHTQRKKQEKVIESGTVVNQNSADKEEEIIVVDDVDSESNSVTSEAKLTEEPKIEAPSVVVPTSLSVEEALARLPPIDPSLITSEVPEPVCICQMTEHKSDFSVDEEETDLGPKFEFLEDSECPSRKFLEEKYHLHDVTEDKVYILHAESLPGINGNCSKGTEKPEPELRENGLFVNVVPNVNTERLSKDPKRDFPTENYKKYSISNEGDASCPLSEKSDSVSDKNDCTFREWHECVETPSYNGEILKILPYVIID